MNWLGSWILVESNSEFEVVGVDVEQGRVFVKEGDEYGEMSTGFFWALKAEGRIERTS